MTQIALAGRSSNASNVLQTVQRRFFSVRQNTPYHGAKPQSLTPPPPRPHNASTRPRPLPNRVSKRHESTKQQQPAAPKPAPQDSTAQYNTIPGPGWAWNPWIEPLKAPFKAYGRMQHRSPYITQLSSGLVIYFLGDLCAQFVADTSDSADTAEEEEVKGAKQYEPARGLRALVIGGIASIPNYRWFMWLGNNFNYASHARSIAVKIVVNQTLFTPCFNTYFFGMQCLLTGASVAEAKQRVVDTVPTSIKNSWKLWPAVTAISFTFVPPQFRSVFAGVIAIGWQTYLSWLNTKAAEEEEKNKDVVGRVQPSARKAIQN